jgi:hypothetical protein
MTANELEEKDVVRELQEKDGKLHVGFQVHAGIYKVPLSNTALCAAVRDAKTSGRVVFFTHDFHSNILRIR